MNDVVAIIQILIFIIAAKILADIWKSNKEVVISKTNDISLIISGSLLCISTGVLISSCLPLLSDVFISSNNINNSSILNFIILVLTSIILAPLLEEVFYRHYLYEKIKSKLNVYLSVLIASIIFGILHFYGLAGLISTILIGVILQIIYINTKKLVNTIIIHAIYNLAILILGLLILPINYITISIFIIIFLISFYCFLSTLRIKFN